MSGKAATRMFGFVAIDSAVGLRDDAPGQLLAAAFAKNPVPPLKRLQLDAHEPTASCWLHGTGWCLSIE